MLLPAGERRRLWNRSLISVMLVPDIGIGKMILCPEVRAGTGTIDALHVHTIRKFRKTLAHPSHCAFGDDVIIAVP